MSNNIWFHLQAFVLVVGLLFGVYGVTRGQAWVMWPMLACLAIGFYIGAFKRTL